MKTELGDIKLLRLKSSYDDLPDYRVISNDWANGLTGGVWANAPRGDWTASLHIYRTACDSITAHCTDRTRKAAIERAVRMLKAGLE